jgi:hypothetical protein
LKVFKFSFPAILSIKKKIENRMNNIRIRENVFGLTVFATVDLVSEGLAAWDVEA